MAVAAATMTTTMMISTINVLGDYEPKLVHIIQFREVLSLINRIKSFIARKTVVATAAVGGSSLLVAGSSFAAAPTDSVDFSGTTLPFTVTGMMTTAGSFLAMYGQWIALALGVLFAPVLYGLAMKLVNAVRAKTART